jgi:protocatechuate 3,4-dioxygenase beta subunit
MLWNKHQLTRRRVLTASAFAAVSLRVALLPRDRALGQSAPVTPTCHDGDEPTAHQTAGPYFKPSSPERSNFIEPGTSGRIMELSGLVLTRLCRPVARALLDVWQADADGAYDLQGYRLRGHLFTDADGRYRLRTIVPGPYRGRTRHMHVRVQAPNRPVLTTQLYFPGEPGNGDDSLYRRELAMRIAPVGDRLDGAFDFVLDQG